MKGKQWRTLSTIGGLYLLFLTAAKPTTAVSGLSIIRIDTSLLAQAPSRRIENSEYLQSAEDARARYASVISYGSADQRFIVDVSRYDRVTLMLKNWPVDEFMYLIEGRLQITDAAGRSQIFAAGDSFIMPKGFSGTWTQLSAIKKIAVSYDPAAPAAKKIAHN